MIKRVVEISQQAHLSCRHRQLVIKINNDEHTVPIEDLGFLILDHPAITHSSRLFAECVNNLVAVLVCDEKHLPVGMFLPLAGNTTQTAHMQKQAQASLALKQRLWKQIVRAKIQAQHTALQKTGKSLPVLDRLVELVRSGDPQNIEAQAARRYFRAFFGDSFRRAVPGNSNQEGKTALLSLLHQSCLFEQQKAPLMVLLQDYAASVRRAIVRQDKQIIFPVAT